MKVNVAMIVEVVVGGDEARGGGCGSNGGGDGGCRGEGGSGGGVVVFTEALQAPARALARTQIHRICSAIGSELDGTTLCSGVVVDQELADLTDMGSRRMSILNFDFNK
ncbi:hypothetical protein L3X38_034086 [Prunus dulcis]|uniref:Uncharacterized protein n=1 Tax=Prunus dulcis TaxID=3755 RepID=A0AAD4YY84_PRUDU|nr:hypothetical protein L3X38_034086 [Prunus dulcis]